MAYTGTDGAIVWRAACWVNAGAITEGQFADAYNGVRVIEPAKSMAYFRSILKDTLGEARLLDLERRTSLPWDLMAGPPATQVDDRVTAQPEHISGVLERAMKRLPQMSADELAERKADFKRQLDAAKNGKAGAA